MRIFKFACQNFSRNFLLSLTSIIIMLLMLFSLSLLWFINIFTQQMLDTLQSKMDLSIYLKQNVNENQVNLLRSELENMVEIREVRYLTPEVALEQFKEKHKDDPFILKSLEELKENPLGAVITIKLRQPSDYNIVFQSTQKPVYQELIQNQDFYNYEKIISIFNKFHTKFRLAGWSITGLFVLIAILIIFNTIKLGILNQEKEIKIMRLVGATSWFIRGPFLIESCLYGFIAWILNSTIIISLIIFSQPYLQKFLELNLDLSAYLKNNPLEFFGGSLAFALIISIFASSAAVKRYLRV